MTKYVLMREGAFKGLFDSFDEAAQAADRMYDRWVQWRRYGPNEWMGDEAGEIWIDVLEAPR